MSELILIRHGQATPFEQDTDQLSELGARQARATGQALAAEGLQPTHVIHGPLVRQRLTAQYAREAAHAPWPVLVPDDRLAEYDGDGLIHTLAPLLAQQDAAFAALAEDFQNKRYSQGRNRAFQLMLEALADAWQMDTVEMGTVAHAEVEAWSAFKERVSGAFRDLLAHAPGSTILVFTSGGVIGLMTALALDAPDTTALTLSWRIKNASLTRLTFGGGRVSLDSFNEVSHLNAEWRSWR